MPAKDCFSLYHTEICKRSFGGEMIHLNKTLNLYKITLSGKYWICGNCGASAWMFTTIWGKVNGEFKVLSWVDYRDQKLTTVDDEWDADTVMWKKLEVWLTSIRGCPHMMSANFRGFQTPPPPFVILRQHLPDPHQIQYSQHRQYSQDMWDIFSC